ncbi:MAG: SpoIIE family protein phosphatase, partial [Candidatus Latescibacteria bacterium]|nr:SpoIIE family protein phosphatase [bacterium]MBD3423668.1 SpoIIE family protein phosphatase [Candidatus Latescibacterota bacterium]
PDSPPVLKNAIMGARIRPCKGVGGDFYDFIRLSEDVTVFVISDISGKGIPASFLMSTLQASIHAEAELDRSPSQVIHYLNNYLYERSDSIRHATLFYASYDEKTGVLDYCNAGALPPILFRKGGREITRLRRGGMLVGIQKDSEYLDAAVAIEGGDLLLAFTDGVTEQHYEGEFFGDQRLIEFVRSNIDLPVDSLLERLFEKLELFCHGNITDDITALALRKL